VDRIRTPGDGGQLWLCGKHVVAPDPEAARQRIAPGALVVCLNQLGDIARYRDYARWLEASPDARWFPIPDFHAPPVDEIRPLIEDLAEHLDSGGDIIMHCSAGMGRAGTTAVCVLMQMGVPRGDAIDNVRLSRPGAGPEAPAQAMLVRDFETFLGSGGI
jgi:predicted protein tyrosine phosphatase